MLDLWPGSKYAYLSVKLPCKVTPHYVLYETYLEPCQIQTYSGIFTSYLDIFSLIVAYLEPCVTLAYSERCYIHNPFILERKIFRTLSRHILAYSDCYVTLGYWDPCHIQICAIFRILAYLGPTLHSESCSFRHI